MRSWITVALGLAAIAGCRGGDGVEPGNGRVYVQSDPPGARITVDGSSTGRVTPDTIVGLGGQHEIIVTLDSLGVSYRYGAQVTASEDSVPTIDGPVVLRCGTPSCYSDLRRYHSFANIRFALNPIGALFLEDGIGDGILWPQLTRNSYASQGMPMFAARMRGDSVGLGIYDIGYLAGRPTPPPLLPPDGVLLQQAPWIIPPSNLIALATIRGLRIEQRVIASSTVPDAVAIQLTFHNISNDPLYQVTDPLIPPGGVIFEHAFIGFGLDADIGNSSDDMFAYAPASDMVFAYDGGWDEPGFEGAAGNAPGLIGLTVLDASPGLEVILNGWQNVSGVTPDWGAGRINEFMALRMMSGVRPYTPEHADPAIGHTAFTPGDVRLLVSVGPLVLVPGDSATVTLAVVLAEPVPGTFETGTVTPPGDPFDATRPLAITAGMLFERAGAARSLMPLFDEQ